MTMEEKQTKTRLGAKVWSALAILSIAMIMIIAAVSTTSAQRSAALSNLPVLNFGKTVLTHKDEVAQTPPPSPSVILYTYHPTEKPTEESDGNEGDLENVSTAATTITTQSDTLPAKKSSTRGGTKVYHVSEKGNTPPPSPSVITYTYHPTDKPTEETLKSSRTSSTPRVMKSEPVVGSKEAQ